MTTRQTSYLPRDERAIGRLPYPMDSMSVALMDRVVDTILRVSLGVRAGQNVVIETWNTGLSFAARAVLRARHLGATPALLFEDEATFVESARSIPKKFRGRMGEHERALLSRTNAYLFVPGPALAGSPGLSREELVGSTAYNSSWYEAATKAKLRGVRMLFGYIGADGARLLGRPLDQIVSEQLRACLVDLQKVRRKGIALSRLLRPRSKVALGAEGEVLSFELGREDGLDDGVVDKRHLATGSIMVNMPPGYYAREILPSSLHGAVRLYAPVPRIGKFADVRFEFDHGRLTDWHSEADQRWLNDLVQSTPKDRRTFGAVAIGLNPLLRRGYGQDRLIEGAVSFMGMFQGTTQGASLEVGGEPVVEESKLA